MELTIFHLYPDFMNLYGEYANLAVLSRHLEALGVSVTIKGVTAGDEPDLAQADMVYMGAGTERRQKQVLSDISRLAEGLKGAADRGALLLFTGSAMEVLGASVTDAAGKVWPCLGLADFTTVETEKRSPVDVVARSVLWEDPAVGFMNKCSVTRGVSSPLFDALPLGFGNEAANGPEGYVDGNVIGTHLTGPALVKNPAFLELIIRRLFALKGWEAPEALPALPHEREAYEVTRRELEARIGR